MRIALLYGGCKLVLIVFIQPRVLHNLRHNPHPRHSHQCLRPSDRAVAATNCPKDQGVRITAMSENSSMYLPLVNEAYRLAGSFRSQYFSSSRFPRYVDYFSQRPYAQSFVAVWARNSRYSLRCCLGNMGGLRHCSRRDVYRRNWQLLVCACRRYGTFSNDVSPKCFSILL